MARIARAVAPGMPYHVTQRGNRRWQTFFNDDDYQAYLELMSEWCAKYKVQKTPDESFFTCFSASPLKRLNRKSQTKKHRYIAYLKEGVLRCGF
jgi:hypothetical protein